MSIVLQNIAFLIWGARALPFPAFGAWTAAEQGAIYARNIKEVFNTCLLRPGQNLCLEFGFVTHTGEEYRFRDPGWKKGDNKLITDATNYFRQAFPTMFFSQRAVSELNRGEQCERPKRARFGSCFSENLAVPRRMPLAI